MFGSLFIMNEARRLIMYITLIAMFTIGIFMYFNMDAIREKLGIATIATLRAKVQEQTDALGMIQNTIKSKDVEIKQLSTQLEITQSTLDALMKEKKTIDDRFKQIVVDKNTKIKSIQKTTGVMDTEGLQSSDTVIRSPEEIIVFKENVSGVNIDSLWESFCNGDESCFKNGTGL
jgi:septal ring factor EnvC (AmiA/AmiB activator)